MLCGSSGTGDIEVLVGCGVCSIGSTSGVTSGSGSRGVLVLDRCCGRGVASTGIGSVLELERACEVLGKIIPDVGAYSRICAKSPVRSCSDKAGRVSASPFRCTTASTISSGSTC